MLNEILLIRHGEAHNNLPPEELPANHSDYHPANPPLTALGERQASDLKEVLIEFVPDVVVVSPFHRTIQTIRPYVTDDTKVSVDRRIGERFFAEHFADFSRIDPAEYQDYGSQLIPDDLCLHRDSFPDFPETRESVRRRVQSLFDEWDQSLVRRVAFVGHGASLAALLNLLIPEYSNHTGHGNCGFSHLSRTPDGWTARVINQQGHLRQTNGQIIG